MGSLGGLSNGRSDGIAGSPPTAHGRLIRPNGARTPVPRDCLRASGWAAFVGEAVSRVEVRLDGETVGLARIGLPRADGFQLPGVVDAPICGFDLRIPPSKVPEDVNRVTVEAVVKGVAGSSLMLSRRRPTYLSPPITISRIDELAAARGEARARRRDRSGLRRSGRGARVAAFAHDLSLGGAQRILFDLLKRLNAHPDVTPVVIAPATGPWKERLELAGVEVHITGERPLRDEGAYLDHRGAVLRWMAERDFTAVVANTLGSFIGIDVAQELDLPSILLLHESFELPVWWNAMQKDDPQPELRYRSIEAIRSADRVFFSAEATRELFEPHTDEGSVVTVPSAVDFGEIDEFRSRGERSGLVRPAELRPDSDVILCLGRVEPRKGQTKLARAWSLIADRHPHAELVFVGASGSPYAEGVSRFIAASGLERCHVIPATMDPLRWYAAADFFVLPSDVESTPLVLAEAMAFENVVVAARVFGVPELITDGEHGFLCPANDIQRLVETLDRVLSLGPAERQRIGAAASRRAREHHDPDRFQNVFETELFDLVGREPVVGVSQEAQAPS